MSAQQTWGQSRSDKQNLYQENCKKVLCKEFNMQNFDTHVNLGHKSKKKQGGDYPDAFDDDWPDPDENADKQDS